MPMPPIVRRAARGLRRAGGTTPLGALISGFAEGVGGGGGGRRRRRKARLTASDLAELGQIKMILGKTAAANALPFYLGRGRG